ncbi:MAG: toprim domain-containing protein [Candidatus Heimdallarchaeota archaeon]
MSKNRLFDAIQPFIRYCRDMQDAIIIVEGTRDRQTLQELGILNLVVVKGGKSVDEVIDLIDERKRVIILTDFDKEGKRLRREFKRRIQRHKGIIIDSFARHFLYKVCRERGVTEIENLDRLF